MRKWIWKALDEVVNKDVYSNLYLRNHLHEVDKKDRALATRIFYGTIQNYRYCKACWSKYVKNKLNPKMDVLLTMSTYQLLFLDKVPSYAIVNDAVNIAKKINMKYAGLTNAVLHKVKPIETDNMALKYSLPDWLYKMWTSQYGQEKALVMAKASVNILPMYVRRNVLNTNESDFDLDMFVRVQDALYIYDRAGHQALQIRDVMQFLGQIAAHHGLAHQCLHSVQAVVDELAGNKRLLDPAAQHPLAHGSAGLIQHPQQGAALFASAQGLGQFKVCPGDRRKPHKLGFVVSNNGL